MKPRPPASGVQIPDKLYFGIGEASRIARVPPHVLRFWETAIPQIAPQRTPSGRRRYSRRDLERILELKDLLYRRRYTLEGARRALRGRGKEEEPQSAADSEALLEEIRAELLGLRRLLDDPPAPTPPVGPGGAAAPAKSC
ncbi:MAG: MerR family transcriptional regulator [Desulfobacterales bacterium]